MSRRIDHSHETDLDVVAEKALAITEKLREEDTTRLFQELASLAQWHPVKTAQVLMTLAAWFDPNITTRNLWARVEAIAEDRTLGRTA